MVIPNSFSSAHRSQENSNRFSNSQKFTNHCASTESLASDCSEEDISPTAEPSNCHKVTASVHEIPYHLESEPTKRPQSELSKRRYEVRTSTPRLHNRSSTFLSPQRLQQLDSPNHRYSVGSASVPLSDRLPRFIRDHQDSEFILMASPRTLGTNRTKERQTLEVPFFGDRRRTSVMIPQDDFEYCSPIAPVGGGRKSRLYSKHRMEVQKKLSENHRKRNKKIEQKSGSGCRECMSRTPFATLIATLLCCVGVGVFCGAMYKGTTISMTMLREVFKLHIQWDRGYTRVEPVRLTFLVVGAAMGGLGLMILFVGCLSTGATRARVYTTWRGRVGGRVSCIIFMFLTYVLCIVWIVILVGMVFVTVLNTMAWMQCISVPESDCIDYNQFGFMFPADTPEEDKRICRGEKKMFCKDTIDKTEVMFILATGASFMVILSLIHYLMCLSANYAHIKDQEKFADLQELQYLRDTSEMSTLPKDRF